MKSTGAIALLGLVALLTPPLARAADTQVVGQLPPGFADRITVRSYAPPIDDGWSVSQHPDDQVFPVTQEGLVTATLALTAPGFHRIEAGKAKTELFLSPGARVEWALADDEPPEFRFAGDDAAAQQHLRDMERVITAARRSLLDELEAIYSLDERAFGAEIDRREQRLRARREELRDRHGDFPAAVNRRVDTDILAAVATFRLYYPSVFNRFTGERAGVPEHYYRQLLAQVDPDPRQLSSKRLVTFLDTYATLEAGGEKKFENNLQPGEKLHSRYRAIRAMPAREAIKSYLFDQMFKTFETNYGVSDWTNVRSAFAADYPDHELLPAVNARHRQALGERNEADDIRVFKTVDGIDLEAHLFLPPGHQPGDQRAAFATFHGGGWAIGTPEWSYPAARRRAAQGLVAVSFEYRIADVHGSDIHDSMEDTRAALRWMRQNAGELGVDPDRVVAHGFSAGAHLAGITAITAPPDSAARPSAIILHSSTYDTTKGGFFHAMTAGNPRSASLTHRVQAGLVPALLLHGKNDHLAPEAEFLGFVERMKSVNNDFEYHLFEVGHFFRSDEVRARVAEITDRFIRERGFLERSAERANAD